MEVTTDITTQPMGVIAGSPQHPHSLLMCTCFHVSFFLFAKMGFPDACDCWAERGTKRNCLGQAWGEANRYLDGLWR